MKKTRRSAPLQQDQNKMRCIGSGQLRWKIKCALVLTFFCLTVLPRQAGGGALCAYAATELPSVFTIGGPQTQVVDSTHFGFGRMTGTRTFQSPYGRYSLEIPKGYQADCGGPYYDRIYYTPEDAVAEEGAAIDLSVVSDTLTDEKPDPEKTDDNAMIMVSFFTNKLRQDGQPFDAQAYAEKLILQDISRPELMPYVSRSEAKLAGASFTHYSLNYTDAMQAYYRTRYPEGGEHPVFDERFAFQTDVYVRELDGKYLFFHELRAGEMYVDAPSLVSNLRPAG